MLPGIVVLPEPTGASIGSLAMPARPLTLLASLGAAACNAPAAPPDLFTASGEVIALGGGDGGVAHACFSCHGMDGGGDSGLSPRLAGLDAGYLHRQLDDYASGRRDHKEMATIARRMAPEARARVSAYYAALPVPARVAGERNAVGARLYVQGDPARGLPACAACHSAQGEGLGPGNPPLAGQPAAYLAAQLDAWRGGRRYNDPLGAMREISRRLTDDEVRAVAAHAASLPAGPRASRAASPSARRDGR